MATGLLTLGSLILTVLHASTSDSSCQDTGCASLYSGKGICVDLGTMARSSVERYADLSAGVSLDGCSCRGDKCSCVCVTKKQADKRAGKPCKANKKCANKKGTCLRPGSQPEGAKDLGLCDKKTKCRCYKSTPPTTPAATTTGPTACTGSCSCSWSWSCSPGCPWQAPPTTNPPTTTPEAPAISGLVLAGGGDGGRLSTVESFPSTACTIPPLPHERFKLSLTLLPGVSSLVVCGGYSSSWYPSQTTCLVWSKGQAEWTHYANLTERRYKHSAAAVEGGRVMVLGGSSNEMNGEITGVEGTFPLQHSGRFSCAFAVQGGREVVVTGPTIPYQSGGHVDRYSSNGSYLGSLPDMLEGRNSHGCAAFSNASGTFYLVSGGYLRSSGVLATTEILAPGASAWVAAAPLPRGLQGLQCGSPGGGVVICAGGLDGGFGDGNYRDEVLQYNPGEDNWQQVGKLTGLRGFFGMVATGDLSFCEDPDQ